MEIWGTDASILDGINHIASASFHWLVATGNTMCVPVPCEFIRLNVVTTDTTILERRYRQGIYPAPAYRVPWLFFPLA